MKKAFAYMSFNSFVLRVSTGLYDFITHTHRGARAHTHIYIYIYVQTMIDVCTAVLLPTRPSSDSSGFRHGFGTEASLPLALSTPAVTHDTTRVCGIFVTLWDCHIHADAVRALSWILFMYLVQN